MTPLLTVSNLHVVFKNRNKPIHAVRGVSFSLKKQEMLALVGESGSGKSVTARAITRLLSKDRTEIWADEMILDDQDLQAMSDKQYQNIRGNKIAMILQDPISSLNPTQKVGIQISECVKKQDRTLNKYEVKQRVLQLLSMVKMPSPEIHYSQYPFELSGGMCQRISIAMAFAFKPQIIIADEPTTALDVTTQAEILSLMKELQVKTKTSIILITHDLGIVFKYCDRALVMYGGEIIESGAVTHLFKSPNHPYTSLLLSSLPQLNQISKKLAQIEGSPIHLSQRVSGCSFFERCPHAMNICNQRAPPAIRHENGSLSTCWLGFKNSQNKKVEVEVEEVVKC
ncbi:MAG: ABC transporter ATP-binding protein [Rhabdochlamydiaceae bacterium]|nr:ABC transporter ATP-binding protein [Candidatus Amphrikana amoebophyrae]